MAEISDEAAQYARDNGFNTFGPKPHQVLHPHTANLVLGALWRNHNNIFGRLVLAALREDAADDQAADDPAAGAGADQ